MNRHVMTAFLCLTATACGEIRGKLPATDGAAPAEEGDAASPADGAGGMAARGGTGGTGGSAGGGTGGTPNADAGGADVTAGPTCAAPMPDRCGMACVDLKTDLENCGQCGNQCIGTQQCLAGKCTPAYQNTVGTGAIPGVIWDVAVVPDGAIYTTGIFKATVDFDPGVKEEKLTALGGGDVFVTRSGPDGSYQWTRAVPSTGDEPWVAAMPCTDGGVFIAGYFTGMADFFPGQPGAKKMATMSEGYVLKLKADGSFGFLRTFPGFYNSATYDGFGLKDGGVVLAGAYSGSVDFGMGPQNMNTGGGFVVKLSSTGTTAWGRTFVAKDLPMGGFTAPGAVTEAADGSVWTAGGFGGTLDLDPGAGTVEAMAGAGQSLFAVKLSGAGQYLEGGAVAVGAKEVGVKDLATAPDGSVFVVGSFSGTSFPTAPGSGKTWPSAGSQDAYVASFSPKGEFRWAHAFGGADWDYLNGALASSDGGVLAVGAFNSPTIDLGSAARPDRREPAKGTLFVTRLAADGSYGGAFTLGGKLTATPSALRPTKDGFLLGGIYSAPVDFNPRPQDRDERTPIGQSVFVSRYAH